MPFIVITPSRRVMSTPVTSFMAWMVGSMSSYLFMSPVKRIVFMSSDSNITPTLYHRENTLVSSSSEQPSKKNCPVFQATYGSTSTFDTVTR